MFPDAQQTTTYPAPAMHVEPKARVPAEPGVGLGLTDEERRVVASALDGLTPRERDVLFEICEGGSNEQVADRLCIALPTVRTHLMRLHQKLGTGGKDDIVRLASRRVLDAYRRGSLGR